MPRKYQLNRRAEHIEETRQRIVEAAVELHEELGPAHTTISALAERAGVERLTVYRHFPDEESLFSACTSHYLAQHPIPDPEPWTRIEDPLRRLDVALSEILAYHRETEAMSLKAARDVPSKPALARVLETYEQRWARIHEVLVSGWAVNDARLPMLRAAIGHAMDFQTWHSLVRVQGLSDDEARQLLLRMVEGALFQRDRAGNSY